MSFRRSVAALPIFLAWAWIPFSASAKPRDAVVPDAGSTPRDYRLHAAFERPSAARFQAGPRFRIDLEPALRHDVAVEHPARQAPVLRVWADGKLVRGPEAVPALGRGGAADYPDARVDFSGDFTLFVRFSSEDGAGTLVAKCPPEGDWQPDAKALFLRDGRLVYDIGWLGAMSGGPRVDDGREHLALLVQSGGETRLWLDGRQIARRGEFRRPDAEGHVLRVGRAAENFGGDLIAGRVPEIRYWARALGGAEMRALLEGGPEQANTPDFVHREEAAGGGVPRIEAADGRVPAETWFQPLERSDHAEIVRAWGPESLEEGRRIYTGLCVVCHGTRDEPGSLPTATNFALGPFANGADPHSMYLTLTHGYGQMVAQPQYTTAQKYAVIHYIREEFLRPHQPELAPEMREADLELLPKGLALAEAEQEDRSLPPHRRMDLGPALFWTYQVSPENLARKGLAVRLDDGPGGVSRGRAWLVYDHETMRVAAAASGDFIDWRDIAFDGSHGSHPRLTGELHFELPVGPGWESPAGGWDDPRPLGRDGLAYGPLPAGWARFAGLYHHGDRVLLAARIHGREVLESPGWVDYGETPVFTRTLNLGPGEGMLRLRVAPAGLNVVLVGDGRLVLEDGFHVAELPPEARSRLYLSRADVPSLQALAETVREPLDLEPLTRGGPARWQEEIETVSQVDESGSAFAVETFPLPRENPWDSWMRPGGFDFTPDGAAAVVAMWNGDVWRVDGLRDPAPATLRWRRIASGLFQPLGVRFRGDDLFVTCRDQIARLHDLNGDGEIDFIECFNSDHQVTEHFHEFAMGLQTDEEGNFYYAKSGRHALDAVLPHHGTLLRVSADGSRTDILATGFRAANGVCLNEDGTYFITDQEGFWTPKNRINRVVEGGFYGNMFGYSEVTDPSDEAMEPPMVWITNEKDRSPAELLRVPDGAWGPLGGSLLNLSYGTGRLFIVPHEEVGGLWQGAVGELPMPAFATGIMRGRFSDDGALYACGMFAWAGNATAEGGFHRIRHTGGAVHVPLSVRAASGRLTLGLSDPPDPASVRPEAFALETWSLVRSERYGSDHHDTREIEIRGARLLEDGRTIELEIPDLAPTDCYALQFSLRDLEGGEIEREIHGTLHRLAD